MAERGEREEGRREGRDVAVVEVEDGDVLELGEEVP